MHEAVEDCCITHTHTHIWDKDIGCWSNHTAKQLQVKIGSCDLEDLHQLELRCAYTASDTKVGLSITSNFLQIPYTATRNGIWAIKGRR